MGKSASTMAIMSQPYFFEAPHLQGFMHHLDRALGATVWLSMHSLGHRRLQIQELESRFLQPLMHARYVLVHVNGGASFPEDARCLLTYAQVSDAAHARLLSDPYAKLASREWCNGTHTWLMDWVNPFEEPEHLLASILPMMGSKAIHQSAWMGTASSEREGAVICREGLRRIRTQ